MEVGEHDQVLTTDPFFLTDLNECLHEELNACSERELCLNLEGSYQCVCHPESLTSSPQKPNCTCEGKEPGTRLRSLPSPSAWTTGVLSPCEVGPSGSWVASSLVLSTVLVLVTNDPCTRSWMSPVFTARCSLCRQNCVGADCRLCSQEKRPRTRQRLARRTASVGRLRICWCRRDTFEGERGLIRAHMGAAGMSWTVPGSPIN